MKILLDTHIIIWTLTDDPRLSPKARELISSADNLVFFSAASLWEISIKNTKSPQKCPYNETAILEYCVAADMEPLAILPRHILAVRNLQVYPGQYLSNQDPFDRLLVAQAKSDRMLLLSHDSNLSHYQESCILMV